MCIPANGYCGHGYYQFSPDLFTDIFSEENGWILKHIYLTKFGLFGHRKWKVPAKYRQWGTYMTSTLCNLHILCIKNESNATIKVPTQRGCSEFWAEEVEPQPPTGLKGIVVNHTPRIAQCLYWFLFNISAGYASNPK